MRFLLVLLPIAVIVFGIWGIKGLATRGRRKRIDDVLEDLREIAWQHRDVDPNLSTIMIDEINKKKKENT